MLGGFHLESTFREATVFKTTRTILALDLTLALSILVSGVACGGGAVSDGSSGSGIPSQVFRDDFGGTTLDSSVWQVATWSEHGGQTGSERCYVRDGCLVLEFKNDPAHFAAHGLYLSSAIQSRGTFLYGRWEARLKPSRVPGVLNSFYTIDWGPSGNGTKQEIDIEFLTKSFGNELGEVHYAVHAEGRPSFNTNPDISLPFDPSADFHVYGIEITPSEIRWTVDGVLRQTYAYNPTGITINAPYQLKLNAWSSTSWVGGPPAAGTVCTYLIDWIQFTPMPQS